MSRDHNTKVTRFGFTIIPHFSCTAHKVQGMTRPAPLANCLSWNSPVALASMLASYVTLSRVRKGAGLLLVQVF